MPHVSKHQIPKETIEKIDEYLVSFLSETGDKTRQRVFRELFTKTERLMIGKRLILILLIQQKIPTHKISEILKMSPSTVASFEKRINSGMYLYTKKWLGKEKIRSAIVRTINKLFAIPFEVQGKSLKQLLDKIDEE